MVGKDEIVRRIALKKYGTMNNIDDAKLRECAAHIDYLTDVFEDVLLEGEKFVLKGFLVAEVTERGARRGRDPNTGEYIDFPPVKSVKCKVSKQIKDLIKNKREKDGNS